MARWTPEQKQHVEAETFKILMMRGEIFPLGPNSGLTGAWQQAQKFCGAIGDHERRENPTKPELLVLKTNLNRMFNEYTRKVVRQWEANGTAREEVLKNEVLIGKIENVLDKIRSRGRA